MRSAWLFLGLLRFFALIIAGKTCTNPVGGSCYEVNRTAMSWSDARNACVQAGGDLAVIKDDATHSHLSNLLGGDQAWIGATSRNLFNWFWEDDVPLGTFSRWASGYPVGNPYTYMNRDKAYYWTDQANPFTYNYICDGNGAPGFCDRADYVKVDIIGDPRACLLVYVGSGILSWHGARSQCAELGTRLASINTTSVFDATVTALNTISPKKQGYWIGLHSEEWEWVDGTKVLGYQKWSTIDPQGDRRCMYLRDPGSEVYQWESADCTQAMYSVCEAPFM